MKKLSMSIAVCAALCISACGGNQSSENNQDSSTTSVSADTTVSNAGATASSTPSDTSMKADRDFVMEAASGGLMEVTLGKLAESNAASAQVKEFGRMMVTDHSKANTELKAVAAKKNLAVSPTPLEKQQKKIDDLKTKKGADFDKAYVDLMVDDHKEDIDKFKDEAEKGNDTDIKAFAAKTLPVLNKHLEHIQKIQDGMKK
jgi:putative membrane protein